MGVQNLEESNSQTVAVPAASMVAAHPSRDRALSVLFGSACRLPVRVLIARKYTLLREGLRLVLAQHDDMQVIGDVADGPPTLRLVEAQQPDILVLDRCPCWREWVEAAPTASSGTGDRAYRAYPWHARDPPA